MRMHQGRKRSLDNLSHLLSHNIYFLSLGAPSSDRSVEFNLDPTVVRSPCLCGIGVDWLVRSHRHRHHILRIDKSDGDKIGGYSVGPSRGQTNIIAGVANIVGVPVNDD